MSHISQLVSEAISNARLGRLDEPVQSQVAQNRVRLVDHDGTVYYAVLLTENEMDQVHRGLSDHIDVRDHFAV